LDLHVLAHLPLDRLDSALGCQDPLVASGLADQQLAVFRQTDERGQDRIIVLGADDGLLVVDVGNLTVRGAQVDPDDDFGHDRVLTSQVSVLWLDQINSPRTPYADCVHGSTRQDQNRGRLFWSATEATPLWMGDVKQSKAVLLPPHSINRPTFSFSYP